MAYTYTGTLNALATGSEHAVNANGSSSNSAIQAYAAAGVPVQGRG